MSGQQITWDTPGSAPPVKWDDEQQPSAASRFGSGLARGAGIVSPEEGKNFFRHPLNTVRGILQSQGELGERAGKEFKGGDYLGAATHGVEYLIPGLGPTLAHAGDQLQSGDTAGGIGTTLGASIPLAAGMPEGRAIPGRVASAAKPVVRAGLKTASDIVDPDVTGIASPRLAHAQRLAGRLADKMAPKPTPLSVPEPDPGILHGPEAPPPEVLKARGLQLGGRAPAEPAAGLGRIPVRAETPAPAVTNAPEMPFGGTMDRIPESIPEKGPIPGSKQDLAETKSIQEAARDLGEREDRARLSQMKSDWFKRNAPLKTKGELTGTAKPPSNPLAGKRMDFPERAAGPGKAVRGVRVVPGANEDLTPLLKKSLVAVKKAKAGD